MSQSLQMPSGQELRDHITQVSRCFSMHHAVAMVPLAYSVAVMPGHVGYVGNAMLFFSSVISGLFVSVPCTITLGTKGALMVGLACYCVYSVFFCLALAVSSSSHSSLANIFVVGSVFGGTGAGVLWTAQVGFIANASNCIANQECLRGQDRVRLQDEIAKGFAFSFLLLEFFAKVAFSAMLMAGAQLLWVSTTFAGCSFLTLAMMGTSMSRVRTDEDDVSTAVPLAATGGFARMFPKVASTISMWSDPRIWLLSTTNITFGFSSAFCNGYINKTYAANELGENAIGFLSAVTVATAAVTVLFLVPLGNVYGRGMFLSFGAASMGWISVLVISKRCCVGWGHHLILIYVLQGFGRAVFESTNKATYIDFFRGKDQIGAFANGFVQTSVSSATCYMLSNHPPGHSGAQIALIASLVTPAAFIAASYVGRRKRSDETPLLNRPHSRR
eukprot:TRINITY_DN36712_c0_g1_i1.p1 TRINITY_DN36712_c0_g1~~TRINITY_DN36712_c0_g1_i1.p1  ORF type:complete len:445 (+),score=45.00 TRINITY_DN36712_c0_g1_i1:157-1491(+)